MGMAATDCGAPFAHDPHLFRDAAGASRACDGDLEKRAESTGPVVERHDRYTIVVNDHAVRATADQERRIRAMTAEQAARFLTIMGRA